MPHVFRSLLHAERNGCPTEHVIGARPWFPREEGVDRGDRAEARTVFRIGPLLGHRFRSAFFWSKQARPPLFFLSSSRSLPLPLSPQRCPSPCGAQCGPRTTPPPTATTAAEEAKTAPSSAERRAEETLPPSLRRSNRRRSSLLLPLSLLPLSLLLLLLLLPPLLSRPSPRSASRPTTSSRRP